MSEPRYKGTWGALLYGLWLLLWGAAASAAGTVAIFLMIGSQRAALGLGGRMMLLVAACTLANVLARIICRGNADRLLTLKTTPGDFSGLFGCLAGFLLAGYLTPSPPGRNTAEVGKPVELAGITLDGKRLDLAEYRGKVVLVDFWATWCGPCVAELPNVRAAYDKYHADGFEVVAVSLDSDRGRLEKFLADHPEPWPQVFDGQAFKGELPRKFEVNAIPLLLVVGRDGTLAAADVRGAEIEAAVAAALGKEVGGNRLGAVAERAGTFAVVGLLQAPGWLVFAAVGGLAVIGAVVERVIRGRPTSGGA